MADVTRLLLSASRMAKTGYKVSLDDRVPYVQNMTNEKITKLRHKNGIYLLDMWVNTDKTGPVFSRQGS